MVMELMVTFFETALRWEKWDEGDVATLPVWMKQGDAGQRHYIRLGKRFAIWHHYTVWVPGVWSSVYDPAVEYNYRTLLIQALDVRPEYANEWHRLNLSEQILESFVESIEASSRSMQCPSWPPLWISRLPRQP